MSNSDHEQKPILAIQFESKLDPWAENEDPPEAEEGPASPEEGRELIRAFLCIKPRSVRSTIIDLVTRLADLELHVK